MGRRTVAVWSHGICRESFCCRDCTHLWTRLGTPYGPAERSTVDASLDIAAMSTLVLRGGSIVGAVLLAVTIALVALRRVQIRRLRTYAAAHPVSR